MLTLLHAGLVAASRQLCAVVIVTLFMSLLASHNLIFQEASATSGNTEALWMSVSPFFIWTYLLIATGWTLSTDRSIFFTAESFRRASRVVRFVNPHFALKALVAQLSLSAILLAVLALRTPESILEVGRQFGSTAAATTIGWAATMSIGVACMGASAHAALRALDDLAAD